MSEQPPADPPPPAFVPVCAIGASAGGVGALQTLFRLLPGDLGLAYVVVVHLSPNHPSAMHEIIGACTRMPVHQVTDGPTLRPNCVYVIAPDSELVIEGDNVKCRPFTDPRGRRAPIDMFFRSIAVGRGDGIAVVLTGAGSDGALGVRAIKEAGGIVMVQEPAEAGFPSMPQNAIATGVADVVAPLARLAERIAEAARSKEAVRSLDEDGAANDVRRIVAFLRTRTGHDFSGYKRSTVLRRIQRRMQVCQITRPADYLQHLRANPEEAKELLSDLLISVTMFFRDPETFIALSHRVIRPLLESRSAGETEDELRAWVVGCATGEEAYSLAILLLEEAEQLKVSVPMQIFATDLDEGALATAREGRYPRSIEADVSAERLKRFFVDEGTHYRIDRRVRDLVLFATHSVVREPPFMRLDLITCRNVLIYLERALQQHVNAIFRYGLKADGYLFLGPAETADTSDNHFAVVDRDARIYRASPVRPNFVPTLSAPAPWSAGRPALTEGRLATARLNAGEVLGESHAAALEASAPPSALVDAEQGVLHLSPSVGRFVLLSAGPLSGRLPSIVRPELRLDLKLALDRAFDARQPTMTRPLDVAMEGSTRRVSLHVTPLPADEGAAPRAIVYFLDSGPGLSGADRDGVRPNDDLQHLHSELKVAQDAELAGRIRSESAVQELRASNEELQSLNEEYRSTAEELETSKEELQSINEELQTVNAELKSKLAAISAAHNDLQNLTDSSEIGTLFLDLDLRIRMFTPPVAELINVTPADVGRPITDLTHRLEYHDLDLNVRRVLRDRRPAEKEVRTLDGGWILLRIRPYRTLDGAIEGAVVTFDNVTVRKQAELALRRSEERFRGLVLASNNTFYRMSADWRLMFELGSDTLADTPEPNEAWRDKYILADDRAEVEAAIAEAIRTKSPFELEHRVLLADGTVGWVLSRAVPVVGPDGRIVEWFGAASDVTERRRAVEALRVSNERHRRLFENMDQGYLVSDVIFDGEGRAIDLAYVQSNAAAIRLVGMDPVGKRLSEVNPGYEAYWYEIWGGVATTGRSERLQRYASPEGRWYDFYVFKLEPANPASHRVAVLFYDATEQKQAEERQGFLLKLSDALRPLDATEAVLEVLTDSVRAQFAASRCAYYEIDGDDYVIRSDSTDGVPSIVGRYPVATFGSALLARHLGGQSTIVVNDVATVHNAAEREGLSAIQVAAYIGVTLLKEDRFVAGLTVHASTPRVWTANEVILAQQIAERAWVAVERARAGAVLRERDAQQAFFLKLSDALRSLSDVDEVQVEACRLVCEQLGAERAFFSEIDDAEGLGRVRRDSTAGSPSMAGVHPYDAFPWVISRLRAGETIEVADTRAEPTLPPAERQAMADIGMAAFVSVPLLRNGVLVGNLTVSEPEPRRWTKGDVELVREAAERIWTNVRRALSETALRDSEERLSQFGEASQDVLWIRNSETLEWTYLTPAFEKIYGLSRDDALKGDNFRNWLELIIPEDREHARRNIDRVRAGEHVTFEYRIRRPVDGEVRWLRNTDFPILDAQGRPSSFGGIGQDVTTVKEWEQGQQVLVAELQHRTRNLMGVVRSMADKTARASDDLDDFRARFRDRLEALARVQGLLSRLDTYDRVTFDDLVRTELAAMNGGSERVTLDGPEGVRLRSSTVQTLAMAIHELATNAVKYGALGQPSARLGLKWSLEPPGEDGKPWLHIEWRESGVAMPPPGPVPPGTGQGRELIERALPYQLRARTSYKLGSDGVVCTISIPVSATTGVEAADDG